MPTKKKPARKRQSPRSTGVKAFFARKGFHPSQTDSGGSGAYCNGDQSVCISSHDDPSRLPQSMSGAVNVGIYDKRGLIVELKFSSPQAFFRSIIDIDMDGDR